jgi:hypothetical protein
MSVEDGGFTPVENETPVFSSSGRQMKIGTCRWMKYALQNSTEEKQVPVSCGLPTCTALGLNTSLRGETRVIRSGTHFYTFNKIQNFIS